jgi:transcription elongation factor SPT5
LHDLVVLSGGETNEVGVIVRVGREEFTVINNHGIVREVRPEEIRGKRNATSGRAVALDMKGNQIRVGDSVRIIEGSHKGKTATIKRMSRAQLFLYSQTKTENAGIIVVRSRSCLLDVSSTQRGRKLGVSDNNTLNNTRSQQSWIDPVGGRFKSIDGLVGKTVRIQSGKWKGYLGVVSDATPTHLQVELHSQLKKVMVIRDRVAVIGDKYGANNDLNRANTNSTSTMTLSTSFNGSETPVQCGETPMHDDIGGDFTPSHSENNDDVWSPEKSNNTSSVDNLPNVNDPSVWVLKNSTFPGHEKSDQSFSTSSVNESKDGWSSRNNQLVRNTWIPLENDRPKFNKSPSDSIIFSEEQSAENATSVAVDEISHDYEEVINAQSIEATSGQDIPKWFMERVCVQIEKSKSNGVIQEINNSNATVQLEDKTLLKVHVGDLIMNTPKEHDTVLVTGGGDVGVEGELVCIDGEDAILKDSNEEFKIVDFVHLAKIIGEA